MKKTLPANAGDKRDLDLIPGSGRFPGEGNGNPLQYSCQEIMWTVEPGRLQSMGSQRVEYMHACTTCIRYYQLFLIPGILELLHLF